MREATEGFYPDRNIFKGVGEFMPTPDVALCVRKLTAHACERIAMLNWLGEHRSLPDLEAAGQAIEVAVDRVRADPASRTRDLGGSLGTRAFGERVARTLASL